MIQVAKMSSSFASFLSGPAWFSFSRPNSAIWDHAPSIEEVMNGSSTSQLVAFIGFALVALVLYTLYAQCCAQPRKRAATLTKGYPSNASLASAPMLSRSSSRDSNFSDFSPGSLRKLTESPYNSFQDLVGLTQPALQHIGASLPAGTLQRAVNKLNERLQYRFVTSKTHVGGGLSSIFVPEEDAPLNKTSPTAPLDAFAEDFLYESDDEEFEQDMQTLMQTEQAFRRSEVFSSLPDTIIKLLVKRCKLQTLFVDEVLFKAGDTKTPSATTYVLISGELSLTIPGSFFTPLTSGATANSAVKAVLGAMEDDECESGEDEMLSVTPGKTITGVSDFIATIVGEPVEYVATAKATSQCVIAEITHEQLEELFDAHEGVREDLLQRYLALLQRVTFTSIYRLTGRFPSSFSTGPPPAPEVAKLNPDTEWATIVASDLGLTPNDVLAFAKEKRKRTTLRRIRTGSFFRPPEDGSENDSESSQPEAVSNDFPSLMTLKDHEILKNDEVALYIVLSGCLEIRTLNFAGDKKGTLQLRAFPSQSVGHLKVLTRTFAEWYHPRSSYDDQSADDEDYPWNYICALGETKVLKIVERDYMELVERFPDIIVHLAKQTIEGLAPLVRLVDVATNFFQAQPGDAVIRQGELVDGLMVVLHGRVRYYYQKNVGGREFGRGAVLGESSFLTNQPSMNSVVAMRRTSLACVPKMIFRCVAARYPNSLAHIGRTISRKMLQGSSELGDGKGDTTKKRRAVAVVPVSPNVPFDSFIYALNAALNAQGIKATVLSSGASGKRDQSENLEFYGGVHSVDSPLATSLDEIEILSRIQDAEEANEVVLFQLDPWSLREDASRWSKLCVAQSDAVLLVANAADRPMPCPLEKRLRQVTSSARRELVMLHVMSESEAPTFLPKNTREWIQELGGVVSSHHIRFHPYDSRLDTFHWKSDMRRLGRWITGNAIGLVLGGGGARGAAHISVLRAYENMQIPIDFIGGTSIGAFVGGLYCMKGGDLAEVTRVFDQFAVEMSSTWNKIRDVTFPIVSYLKGYQFNRSIVRVFGDANIEDFWTNFYCVTTDLTDSREIAHRNGFAWKYIRASMTLTGYLPPICDVQIEDGVPVVHYLVDGGYIDNMPVDEMRRIVGRSGVVVAVDVQSEWKLSGEDYGEDLNGWWYLWRWLSPFHTTPSIPTASEIQSHLAFISCVQRFGKSMNEIPVDLYLAPPLGSTLTLEFNVAKKLQEQTYLPVLEKLKGWLRDPKTKRRTFLQHSVALANVGIMPSPMPSPTVVFSTADFAAKSTQSITKVGSAGDVLDKPPLAKILSKSFSMDEQLHDQATTLPIVPQDRTVALPPLSS